MINGNTLARKITKREGGKVNLSIAQVKEVLRITREELVKYSAADICRWLDI